MLPLGAYPLIRLGLMGILSPVPSPVIGPTVEKTRSCRRYTLVLGGG